MATWQTSNSVITDAGIIVFNKIRFGIGNLTISKILISDGVSSPESIHSLTDLVGNKKDAILSGIIPGDSGSEISLYVTNEGLSEDMKVRQIGIFVTHPDIQGEILYFVTQSDEENCDVLPKYQDSITSFGYSVFFEHSRTSSVVAETRQGDSIPKISSPISGNIPSITVNGDLKNSDVSIESVKEVIEKSMRKGENIVLVQGVHYGDELPTGEDDLRRPVGSIFFKKVTG